MVHPVQSVIESLYAAGRCPRLHVNALFEGVNCPDFIREQWRERLIIDLDPTYPLDLTFEDGGLGADLSFGGYVTRCSFPYGAVYVVADRSTGRGIVLDQHMPDSVKRTRYGQASAEAGSGGTQKPSLRPIAGSDAQAAEPQAEPSPNNAADSSADPPGAPRPDQPASPSQADGAKTEGPDSDLAAPAAADQVPKQESEQVQKRRAAFRVIDGGS